MRHAAKVRNPPFATICAGCSIGQSGLVLCFPYQSARIDPVAINLFLMGIGGGWIVVGLVVMDRL